MMRALTLLLIATPVAAQLQVDAGPDQVVTTLAHPPDVVVDLHGQVTPASANATWSYASGHGRPRFADATRARTTATFTETGPITLRLTATSGSQTVSDTMTVTVLVPRLAVDNLVTNPWFRDASKTSGSMNGWTVARGWWTATKKDHNPSPDVLGYTAADLDNRGVAGDTWIYQDVAADPTATVLRFQTYWVTISMQRIYARILAAQSQQGPWTEVWVPWSRASAHTKTWSQTALVETQLSSGAPWYRIELHGVIPEDSGAAKLTGVYLSASRSGEQAARYDAFGSGCHGSAGIPTLAPEPASRPITGATLRARYASLPAAPGAVVHCYGVTRGVFQLTPVLPGCTLYTTLDVLVPIAHGGSSVVWSLPIPGDSRLVGAELFNQGLVLDPKAPNTLGLTLSNAARVIVGSR